MSDVGTLLIDGDQHIASGCIKPDGGVSVAHAAHHVTNHLRKEERERRKNETKRMSI